MDFHQGFRPVEDLAAQLGEGDVAPACNQVVGQFDDFLLPRLMRHLGATEHDDDLGRHALEHGHQFRRFLDVPYIDAKTDDARLVDEDALDQFRGLGADDKFLQPRLRLQRAHIGQQVAQAQRSVGIAGVQGGEQDGHDGRDRGKTAILRCTRRFLWIKLASWPGLGYSSPPQ